MEASIRRRSADRDAAEPAGFVASAESARWARPAGSNAGRDPHAVGNALRAEPAVEATTVPGAAEDGTAPVEHAPARRIRVLAVANWDWAAAPTPWAVQRVEALRRAGAAVEVLALDCVDSRHGFFRLARALRRRLAAERYDVVAPLYGSLLGLLCALQRRAPCAVSFAGSDLNGTVGPGGRLLPSALPGVIASQLAAALAAGVSVRNPAMRRAIWWPPARRAATIIPSGVDVRRFQPMPRVEARKRRGLPIDGVRIAFVALDATRRASKRLDLARAAVELLPGAALDVMSSLPHTEMPSAYAAADALLFTSRLEGSPNCVKEALACAVPVVSVEVGDVREVLEGLTNCVIAADDPAALAAALRGVIADGRGCPDGPARMAELHSLDRMATEFVRFYERLIAE